MVDGYVGRRLYWSIHCGGRGKNFFVDELGKGVTVPHGGVFESRRSWNVCVLLLLPSCSFFISSMTCWECFHLEVSMLYELI